MLPSVMQVAHAHEVLRRCVAHTPLLAAPDLSLESGAQVSLKAESLQRAGTFHLRGACYKLMRLPPELRERGVVAGSGGNHALAVATVAADLGIHAIAVLPTNAPRHKVRAIRAVGAQVVQSGASFAEAAAWAELLCERTGAVPVHAFADAEVIAGQATVGLEIMHAAPETEMIVVPVGGGGLLAGIAIAVRAAYPWVRIAGVQARRMPSMRAALRLGRPVELDAAETLADGLNVNLVAPGTLEAALTLADEMVTVSEAQIGAAMRSLLVDARLVVEGAGAVGVAAIQSGALDVAGKRVVVVLSGGNVGLATLSRLADAGALDE
jgi:threonine dehydratase